MFRTYITKSRAGHYTATVKNAAGLTARIIDKQANLQTARAAAQAFIESQKSTPHYVKEHPTFPVMPEVAELEALGFEDQSWHNDSCPCFETKIGDGETLRVWIEHPNPDMRESTAALRFYIECFDTELGNYGEDVRYIGDDWAMVLATIEAARGEK